ncbi:hypothetical protein BRADI_3g57305v3 [Brachypodium distachyon]|uniref:RNase H type-1 domain-containing protein n=1 Tax=Brachypodium distachyon TaxID=15368 RepID=A0A2K2D5H4_BRADI|nr:hypothetical protein BRADI_3g57305v3 [Brachypodium distachyon]
MGLTSSRPDGSSTKWKAIWNEIVPRKVNIFTWKLARDALPTQFLEAISDMDKVKAAMLFVLLWCIWHVHNDIKHDKVPAPVEASKRFLCSYMDSLLVIKQHSEVEVVKGKQVASYSARSMKHKNRTGQKAATDDRWIPPDVDFVKLSVDGSFSPANGSAGVGLVLRNHGGEIIISACRSIQWCNDALEAELLACEEGLRAAIGWSDKIIILESDCAKALSLISAKILDRSPYAMCVREIRRLLDAHPISVGKISRNQNGVSHILANLARSNNRTGSWIRHGPDEILHVVILDCSRFTD